MQWWRHHHLHCCHLAPALLPLPAINVTLSRNFLAAPQAESNSFLLCCPTCWNILLSFFRQNNCSAFGLSSLLTFSWPLSAPWLPPTPCLTGVCSFSGCQTPKLTAWTPAAALSLQGRGKGLLSAPCKLKICVLVCTSQRGACLCLRNTVLPGSCAAICQPGYCPVGLAHPSCLTALSHKKLSLLRIAHSVSSCCPARGWRADQCGVPAALGDTSGNAERCQLCHQLPCCSWYLLPPHPLPFILLRRFSHKLCVTLL